MSGNVRTATQGYAFLRFPVAALVTAGSPSAVSYLKQLADDELASRLPSRRRSGPAVGWAATWPVGAATAMQLGAHYVRDAELDKALTHFSGTGLVALERASTRVVFVFTDGPYPSVVLKLADDTGPLTCEERALRLTAAAGVTPWTHGHWDRAFVQDGVAGRPAPIAPVFPEEAAAAAWTPAFASLCQGLTRIGEVTAHHRLPAGLSAELSAAAERLQGRQRRLLAAAVRHIERRSVSVVCHGDCNARHWLVEGERLTGIVGWQHGRIGLAGIDILHAAVSTFEQALNTPARRPQFAAAFEDAWHTSPLFSNARRATEDAAEAVGGAGGQSLEAVYFAQRLAREATADPDGPGVRSASRLLDVVLA